jgi:hypothetical protein
MRSLPGFLRFVAQHTRQDNRMEPIHKFISNTKIKLLELKVQTWFLPILELINICLWDYGNIYTHQWQWL